MKSWIRENGLYVSWGIALIATMGSLYFSEIKGYTPCLLCWYQRLFMYPLIIILGAAAVKGYYKIANYVLPITIVGGSISLYHYLYEKTNLFKSETGGAFCGRVPCDIEYINWFGFITIPFLALTAFVLIAMLQLLIIKYSKA